VATPVSLPIFGQGGVNQRSPAQVKIVLFRSLFHGREDVYPQRFESRKTGRAGYSPACGNEWVRGICEKPRIKCSECPHQRFLRITDEIIRWHLCGHDDKGREFVMGVYPMLRDETCFFLAADFDKATWQQDAGAFLETCQQMNVPAALERSRSGNGGHVWFFFMKPFPPPWRASWVHTYSRKPWNAVPKSVWIRTIGSFQIKTHYRWAASAT
jgi:hypothetical protein